TSPRSWWARTSGRACWRGYGRGRWPTGASARPSWACCGSCASRIRWPRSSPRRRGASASSAPRAAAHAVRPGRKLSSTMTTSRVRLPRDVRQPYEVYLNGVRQQLGADYSVREGALVFRRELRKDKISGWRWLLGAWGVGTYRQNDSVDVRYAAPDGSPRVAEALDIEIV